MFPHQRFESYLSKPQGRGCRLWQGPVKAGRGLFLLSYRPHKWISAHKWAYRFYHEPVPPGYVVKSQRTCDPLCMVHLKLVRANTLVLKAIQEGRHNPYRNLQNCLTKGFKKGKKNPQFKYPKEVVKAVRIDHRNGMKIQVISLRRKLPVSTVWWLVSGRGRDKAVKSAEE